MLTTKDDIDFKKVNKNLKLELSKIGFEISNQSCLNLLSRALGVDNYNTYKAIFIEENNSESVAKFDFKNFALKKEDFDKMEIDRLLQYPPIEKRNFKNSKIQFENLNIFIHYDNNLPYILIGEKKSITGRVYYSPEYKTFSFFIYPSVREGLNDYHIEIKTNDLMPNFLDTLHHIGQKYWFNIDFLHDFISLFKIVHERYAEFQQLKV